jgi:DNA-binding IclR family transcriptional regulator
LLDHLDQNILVALAQAPMGPGRLSRRIQVCEPTIKRRCRLLGEKRLVNCDPQRFYSIARDGLAALGDAIPRREPWVRPEAVAASLAKDVVSRPTLESLNLSERGRRGGRARWKSGSEPEFEGELRATG